MSNNCGYITPMLKQTSDNQFFKFNLAIFYTDNSFNKRQVNLNPIQTAAYYILQKQLEFSCNLSCL